MKVTYFASGVKDVNTEGKALFDIRPFLRAFCRLNAPRFKNSFIHNDENVYLIHHLEDVFLFVMTKDKEVVRRIDSSDISVSGINDLLGRNEHLGFASYVVLKENFIGFGSTIFAPKVDVFVSFVNKLLAATGSDHLQFYLHALMHQATKDEAHEFTHIGTTHIEIGRENSKLQDVLAVLGGDYDDAAELQGMRIILKPRRKQNIKEIVEQVMEEMPEDGLERFMMRAKAEVGSQTMDLYLTGKGAVSDVVSTSDDSRIAEHLMSKANSNAYVAAKLSEYVENEEFEEVVLESVLHYSDVNSWASLVSRLQHSS